MKTIYSVYFLPFLVVLLLVGSANSSSDWVKYRSDKVGTHFYKKGNTKRDKEKYIVQVWAKWVYSDQGREKEVQDRKNLGLSTEGYDKLKSTMYLYEMDCKEKRYRLLSINDYGSAGKVLFFESHNESEWDYIYPDSVADILLKKVCK